VNRAGSELDYDSILNAHTEWRNGPPLLLSPNLSSILLLADNSESTVKSTKLLRKN